MKNQQIYKDKKNRKSRGNSGANNYDAKSKPERGTNQNDKGIGIIKCGSHKAIQDTNLASNDPSWYKDKLGVTEDSARIATYVPNGKAWWSWAAGDSFKVNDPVACIVGYVPCPAVSTGDSPISIAAQVVLQQIKKVLNKPVLNYQAADPIMAYIAFLNIVVMTNEIHRDYALMNSYSTMNLAYPKGILQALGYNPKAIEDLRTNMARYRQVFNTTLYKISSIFMPFENNILEKYKWLSSGLWLDHDNTKGQVYGYASEGYYVYSDVASDQGTSCVFHHFTFEDRKADDTLMDTKLRNLDVAVETLRNSDSWAQMVSDMQRAFPDSQTYSFPLIEENELPNISYNYDMLQQFQNVHTTPIVDLTAPATSLNITQDVKTNTVISQPVMAIGQSDYAANFGTVATMKFHNGEFYNFDKLNPSTDEIIENTAATTLWTVSGTSVGCADNDFTHAIYTGFYLTIPSYTQTTGYEFRTLNLASVMAMPISDWHMLLHYSKLDYAPLLTIVAVGTDSIVEFYYPYGETDNLVQIGWPTLKRLFMSETFALWNVPNNVITGKVN